MNKTIAILYGGPPKPYRNRHLEVFNGKTCISHVINSCTIENIKVFVVLSIENKQLKNFIHTNFPFVNIV